jgi:hypothetical protein
MNSSAVTVSDGLAANHPGFVTDRLTGLIGQSTGGRAVQELGTIDHRRGFDQDEEIAAVRSTVPGMTQVSQQTIVAAP